MANLEKKEKKRVAFHENKIEALMTKIWKCEQQLDKVNLKDKKREQLQETIRESLLLIEIQEEKIETGDLVLQAEY